MGTLNLEEGQATVDTDRRHILNSIVGRVNTELDLEPLATHDNYQNVNDILRGRFSSATLGVGAQQDENIFQAYLSALSRSGVTSLFFDVPNDLSEGKHHKLVNALPISLESMVIRGSS